VLCSARNCEVSTGSSRMSPGTHGSFAPGHSENPTRSEHCRGPLRWCIVPVWLRPSGADVQRFRLLIRIRSGLARPTRGSFACAGACRHVFGLIEGQCVRTRLHSALFGRDSLQRSLYLAVQTVTGERLPCGRLLLDGAVKLCVGGFYKEGDQPRHDCRGYARLSGEILTSARISAASSPASPSSSAS
jgi:hypothetical protein